MKLNRRIPIIGAAIVLGGLTPLTIAAAAHSTDAADDAILAEATEEFEERLAVYDACTERAGLTVDGTLVEFEDTRQTRTETYRCLVEGWPNTYGDTPTPLAPPSDWDPDAPQLEYQNALTDYLSEAMTAETIDHKIVTEPNGVRWVDYDDLDPVAASTVGEIIARGDHLPDPSNASD